MLSALVSILTGAYRVARAVLSGPLDPVRVTEVLAINESHAVGESYVEWFRPDSGLELVQAQIPWKEYRIEVRYEHHGVKYRVVYRPDDAMEYPPRKAFGLVRAPRLARAVCVPIEADEYDVTERVRKYMGPERDFHAGKGTRLHLSDMFPFDDHEHEGENVSHVRLEMDDGTVAVYEWADDPRMVAPRRRNIL